MAISKQIERSSRTGCAAGVAPRWVTTGVFCASMVGALAAVGDEVVKKRLPADTLPAKLSLDVVPRGLGKRIVPEGNALTAERVQLGRRLFFDAILSADRSLACASCHLPDRGFASANPVAVGVKNAKGTRNAPTVLNRALGKSFFWDGRADSLEAQALKPIANPLELASDVPTVVERLKKDDRYRNQFLAAYGDVTAENLARALASFQRVLLSGDSVVDRFQSGDSVDITVEQKQGLWIFESRGGCWKCHSGSNYSDEQFHNTGVSWGKTPLDLGRHQVTKKEQDRGRFKTPTLREIARTAPYMHDGSMKTLEEVVDFYDKGGRKNPHLSPQMKPLGLSDKEKGFLVAFLKALNGSTNWGASAQKSGR